MAAGFKFKLDFLIKLRARREEEARARLARRLASIRELEAEIEETAALKERLKEDLEARMAAGGLTVALLTLYRDYDYKLAKDLARLRDFLRLSQREEAKERAALVKASVDRKVMEKLKDRRRADFLAALAYKEMNEAEEMAALARARRGPGSGLEEGR